MILCQICLKNYSAIKLCQIGIRSQPLELIIKRKKLFERQTGVRSAAVVPIDSNLLLLFLKSVGLFFHKLLTLDFSFAYLFRACERLCTRHGPEMLCVCDALSCDTWQ